LFTNAYYLLKPFIPRTARITVRRVWAKVLRRRFSGSWPIDRSSVGVPEGWRGWPDGKKFAFVLTHDVEGRQGLDRCHQLAEVEMNLGFRSSFNFVPEGEYSSEPVREFLSRNGFEVGVHDLHHDGSLYRSWRDFKAQSERINYYLNSWNAVGFRAGFMFHNLHWLKDLNILWDASTFDNDPFEPQPQGVNTLFPFWVSRPDQTGYVELPYTLAQDSTLFLILRERGIDLWKRKLDWVAGHGGLALVNVHPDSMNFNGKQKAFEYRAALYQELLEYAVARYRQEAWFALPGDVARYVSRHKPSPPPAVIPAVS